MNNRVDLSPAKKVLLDRWLQGDLAAPSGQGRIPRRAPDEPVPLSFQQYRLWFLDQLTPGGAFANIDVAVHLDFPLDPRVLARAINDIIKRHEALRTRFVNTGNGPVQIVAPALAIDVPVIDLRYFGVGADAKAVDLATTEARRPFNLSTGPLLRATVLRLAVARYVLVLTIHHIVADGWSLRVFFDELAATYEAIGQGKPQHLPPLPVQYGDFAVWQRKVLGGDQLEAHVDHWIKQLSDLPVLDLQTDFPRPAVQSFAGSTVAFSLPAKLVDQLRQVATRAGATLFMGLLTGFADLISRYTGQSDLPIATYTAGRSRAEVEPLIGFFINTVILRLRTEGNPTFEGLLARVRDVALEAYAHEDVPFERLVEALAPPRDPSRNPLVQVAFQLVSVPKGHAKGRSDELAVERGTANFDLCCSLMEDETGGVKGRIEFSTDLFAAATIARLVGHYQRNLEAAVAQPKRPLADIDLLSEVERGQLALWNDTAVAHEAVGLADLFARRVAASPTATAIVTDAGPVTYAELDRRSTTLAQALVNLGIGPERIVGVNLTRSVELFVASLAIVKAGGAYLALDPSYPTERLAMMAQDAPAAVVISSRQLRYQMPICDAVTLLIDELPAQDDPTPPPHLPPDLNRLCYVIYTSGSTGVPKGVAVEEAQVVNRLHWGWAHAPFQPGEMSVVRTPTNFVDSLWELWGPLLAGSPTVIAPAEARVDPDALLTFLARHRVTRIWMVPSLLQAILDAEPNLGRRVPALKMWVLGGEPLTSQLAKRFFAAAPDAALYNSYGMSEIWDGTWHRCAPGETTVPIGKPIANTQCLVLDQNRHPVPVGIPGELYIAGTGIARGYLHRPDLSAERFLAHPGAMNGRVFRTSDRARWREDGTLECLGRLDQQVKIRGARVELAEVEAALNDLPGIAQAAVKVWPDKDDRNCLVAYILATPGFEPTLAVIRRQLGKRLPDPMIPTTVVAVQQFPQTPSGKLDRRALPPPQDIMAPEREVEAARSPVEVVLLRIWQEVLGTDQIGVRDNFFDLGGHSLLATQIVSRIRATFDVSLSLQTFFNLPSIAGIADAITEDPAELQRITRTAEIVLSVAALSDDEVSAMLASEADFADAQVKA